MVKQYSTGKHNYRAQEHFMQEQSDNALKQQNRNVLKKNRSNKIIIRLFQIFSKERKNRDKQRKEPFHPYSPSQR